MAESGKNLITKFMHQKLNACFKRLQYKKEEVDEDEKALIATKKQVKEKAFAVQNKQQFKGTCMNYSKYGHKAMNCQEKKSEEQKEE